MLPSPIGSPASAADDTTDVATRPAAQLTADRRVRQRSAPRPHSATQRPEQRVAKLEGELSSTSTLGDHRPVVTAAAPRRPPRTTRLSSQITLRGHHTARESMCSPWDTSCTGFHSGRPREPLFKPLSRRQAPRVQPATPLSAGRLSPLTSSFTPTRDHHVSDSARR